MSDLFGRRDGAAALFGVLCCCLSLTAPAAFAQPEPSPLRTFGYFQNSFQQQWDYQHDRETNTFLAQQLNLFLQKDLGERWTALVDFEVVNNFSSTRRWGSFNLEEAWIRYRASRQFNLKVGLHIPPFNNLNEIKNRTPLLPYIIRPFVYETSLGEAIDTETYLPARAFGQIYGFFPVDGLKIDYALYLGNSPNINDQRERGQTGADTSNTFLVGGRLGLRVGELKAGVSAARDYVNPIGPIPYDALPGEPEQYQDIARTRLGADLSYTHRRLYLETEIIRVDAGRSDIGLDMDLYFWYGTLGYFVTDRLLVYGSYWTNWEWHTVLGERLRARVNIPTGGASYMLNDMMTLKAQYAYVDIDAHGRSLFPAEFGHFSTAVSVVF